MTTDTTPMPPVPAGLGQIELDPIPTDPRTGDLAWLFDELRGKRPITAAGESLDVPAEVERRAILLFLARAAKGYRGDDHLSQRYTLLELPLATWRAIRLPASCIDELREGDHHRGVR